MTATNEDMNDTINQAENARAKEAARDAAVNKFEKAGGFGLTDSTIYHHGFEDGWDAARAARSPHTPEAVELQAELDWVYSQEQNIELSSFWDGGWTLRFGDATNGFGAAMRFDSASEVSHYLRTRRGLINAAKENQ